MRQPLQLEAIKNQLAGAIYNVAAKPIAVFDRDECQLIWDALDRLGQYEAHESAVKEALGLQHMLDTMTRDGESGDVINIDGDIDAVLTAALELNVDSVKSPLVFMDYTDEASPGQPPPA